MVFKWFISSIIWIKPVLLYLSLRSICLFKEGMLRAQYLARYSSKVITYLLVSFYVTSFLFSNIPRLLLECVINSYTVVTSSQPGQGSACSLLFVEFTIS